MWTWEQEIQQKVRMVMFVYLNGGDGDFFPLQFLYLSNIWLWISCLQTNKKVLIS